MVDLFLEFYRWIFGIAIVILAYKILRKLFRDPFKDDLNPPDYMIRINRK